MISYSKIDLTEVIDFTKSKNSKECKTRLKQSNLRNKLRNNLTALL